MYEFLSEKLILNQEIALEAPGRSPLTYLDMNKTLTNLKDEFGKLAINKSDPVAIVLPNGPDLGMIFLASACFAIAAPLNPSYSKNEFLFFLKDLGARLLVVDPSIRSSASLAAKELSIPVIHLLKNDKAGDFRLKADAKLLAVPNKLSHLERKTALLLHTSGTTSTPKLVPLTASNLIQSAQNVVNSLQLSAKDSCLNIMPLFHIHGLVAVFLSSILSQGRLICSPGFNVLTFFKLLKEYTPSWYSGVPTMHQAILQRAVKNQEIIKLKSLRFIRSSSAALPTPVLEDLENTFKCPVIEAYGMTEASHQIASNQLPPQIRKPGIVGIAAGPEIRVIGDDGNDLPVNCVGEIVIRGKNVIKNYSNNPEANRNSFYKDWFRTGDLGALDPDGYLKICGRIKEIINKGGEKISPKEIDDVLQEIPAINQVVCFGISDKKYGEELGCAIVLKDGTRLDEQEVIAHASKYLARFKIPKKFVFLNEIPKGPTGKIQRIGLAKKIGVENA